MLTDSQEPPAQETSPQPDSQSGSGPTSLFRDKILIGTVIGAFVLDQVSKRLITSWLDLGESWPSEGFFRITYGTNSGTAFGLFPNHTTLLIVVSLVAIGFLFYFYRAHAMPSLLLRFAIGLQLGGAFGNLIDRVLNGKVVDFIDVGPWPIFNLADSSIVVGIFILMAVFLLTKESTEERQTAPATPENESQDPQASIPASAQDE
ncbi:MAG: signal peptidase II [Dehalococcoidia bacterium]|nr:signal peptidase II [Dehalococcoidia bacterium]